VSRRESGATPATVALERAGVAFAVHRYQHNPATESYGLEAAAALGVAPSRVFKTLMAAVDRHLTVAVVPAAGTLDLKALAAVAGGKRAELADARTAERSSGYVIGGISPIAQRTALPTVIDSSALDFETIYVSGGRRGFEVEVAASDLARLTLATVAAISRQASP
jgi:Cys-tRNA(Pro)/Cys-tRNA(Cys) deacylase